MYTRNVHGANVNAPYTSQNEYAPTGWRRRNGVHALRNVYGAYTFVIHYVVATL